VLERVQSGMLLWKLPFVQLSRPLAPGDVLADLVDGSSHHRDYVQEADERKRQRSKALGYRIVGVRGEELEAGLADLAVRLGGVQ
jgi:hypothetical protein